MSNSFGTIFRITTFGESHGPMIGVVIDGCPAGLDVTEDYINQFLALRQPGKSEWISPRAEADRAKILSGVFANKTTGAPIAIVIENQNFDSAPYEATKNLLKPGHANYTYAKKYGIYDYRGSGRASARETACRVAAGAVAMKILEPHNIKTTAYLKSVGNVTANITTKDISLLKAKTLSNAIYCPDEASAKSIMENIIAVKNAGDSIGGLVEFILDGLPIGLGEPIYEKFSAKLANAIFSIPAVKGFEMGDGFKVTQMRGSENNDLFISAADNKIALKSNHAGGVLGGITNGMPIVGRVAFKPTPSITMPQPTVDFAGKTAMLDLPSTAKHDPCVAIRGVIVVEAMCILVIADTLLMNNSHKF
jgi:chorismate synthase